MPKNEGVPPNSEPPVGDGSSASGPLKISRDALELLRTAAAPSEFLKIARKFILNKDMLFPEASESYSNPVEMEPGSVAAPEAPFEPEMETPVEPWPEKLFEPRSKGTVELDWQGMDWTTGETLPKPPKEIPLKEDAETFYLTDLTLDLRGCVHMTSGLHVLAFSTLAPIVVNLSELWRMGQVYFFQDGPPPDEEDEDDDEEKPPKTCDAEFVSERRSREWYRNKGFGEKLPCPKTRTITIPATRSLPIYWAIAGAQWTKDGVRKKLEKAREWFSRYCISLNIKETPLQQGESSGFSSALARMNAQGRAKFDAQIREIYKHLWKNRLKRPRRFLLMLFVDAFNEVVYERAIADTSGNFADIPVILITSADKTSSHIVSHELVHGLGKGIIRDSPPKAVRWVDAPKTSAPESVANANNTWLEGGCDEEMGNADRRSSSVPMVKRDTAPMDWASYFQYSKLSKSIRTFSSK